MMIKSNFVILLNVLFRYTYLSNFELSEIENDDEENVSKMEGFLYIITKSKNLEKMWFKLVNKDLYCKKIFYKKIKCLDFKHQEDTDKVGMHHLSGVYTSEEKSTIIENKQMFCFSMIYANKTRHYYCEDETEFRTWLNIIQKVTGVSNISDTYDIMETLGTGKFGVVKVCQNKTTKRKAAIKILSKKNMSSNDTQEFRSEVEILKICQHPNIIKLYDIFENHDYIYISILVLLMHNF